MHERVVIIVDDEEDICRLLASHLRKKYPRVLYALTLRDGLRLAAETRPEVLILDNNLPDGIGIQMIPEFRISCEKIIVISAMNNLQAQALNAGADAFLAKPVSFRDIDGALK